MHFFRRYIYLILFIVALITLVTFSSESNNVETIVENEVMPKDDVHNTFESNNSINPSGSNVSSSIITKMKDLEDYVQSNPNDTLKIKEYADLLAGAHNEDNALDLYILILSKDEGRTDIISNISVLYYNKNMFPEAKEYIIKLIESDPKDTEAIYNLGVVEARMGDIDAAKKQWEDLSKNHPNTKMSDMAKESIKKLMNSGK